VHNQLSSSQRRRKNKLIDQKEGGLIVQSRRHILYCAMTVTFADRSVKGHGQAVKGEQLCSLDGGGIAGTSPGKGHGAASAAM